MYLHRNGGFENPTLAPAIDQLTYGYATNSNQLLNVSDATNDAQGFKDGNSQQTGDDYDYDAYGNMTKDQNKGITHIKYNHMNLPTEIDFVNNRKISYLYTAMGTKIQKTIDYGSHQVVTDYCDGYQYETKPQAQGGRGYAELLFFPTAEGYVKTLYKDDLNEKAPAAFQYIYIYKDHLGNNRLSYTLDPQTEQVKILEENHYYPFGLKHGSYNNTKKEVKYKEELAEKKEVKQVMADKVAFKYKYNGKELQDELGLNVYDYGARIYEPAAPHFWQIDPLAEKYSFQSVYVYANNNPVFYIDINGMGVDDIYIDENGNYLGTDGAETKNVRVVSKKTWDNIETTRGVKSESGTNELQSPENSTLLVGTDKQTQPGYQKGISISDETWSKIEEAGGTRAEPVVSNESDNLIQIKPEHEVKVGPGAVGENEAVDVKSGQSVYGMVDAIATNRYSDASFKIRDGNTATVTNNGISINSYGGLRGYVGFVVGGGWGFEFPDFVKNKTVGVNGVSLAKEQE